MGRKKMAGKGRKERDKGGRKGRKDVDEKKEEQVEIFYVITDW
jgi:hypothetical protein